MTKTITIDGKPTQITANALLPKQYRAKFGRDLISDMKGLVDAYNKDGSFDTDVLERLTWLMLRAAGNDVGDSPDEWLGSLDSVFGLYEILPDVIGLWTAGTQTTSSAKKK